MKRFPYPLQLTVPVVLMVLGSLTGGWVMFQQLMLAHLRLESEGLNYAKQASLQTSSLLEYLYRRQATNNRDSDGDTLVMGQLATDSRLVMGVVLDENNRVSAATRYELIKRPIDQLQTGLKPDWLVGVRSTQEGKVFLDQQRNHIYGIYPIQLPPRAGELRSSRLAVLLLVYDLNPEMQGLLMAGLARAPIDLGVLLGLCFLTWIVFDRLVARRAKQVVNICQRWEQGDTEARIQLDGSDEFAQIGAAFDLMAERVGESTATLRDREQRLHDRTAKLEQALKDLKQTQAQLIQTEKLSGLGQLVAGIAHEVNNPIGFIHSNLYHVDDYVKSLLSLIELYQQHYPVPAGTIQAALESTDLEFISQDLPQTLASMRSGTDRIRNLVLSLRNFSRLDESGCKVVNLHDGLDSTITVLQSRLRGKDNRPDISVVKVYDRLPPVECYPGQLNQVFAHLISNAIDAFETLDYCDDTVPTITLKTQQLNEQTIQIRIVDNGPGMEEVVRSRIFDPFFTTKPIGKGTGLGLSLSYDIITKNHGGQLLCHSIPGQGTEVAIELPISQKSEPASPHAPASQPQ